MAKELDRWGIIGKRGQINLVGYNGNDLYQTSRVVEVKSPLKVITFSGEQYQLKGKLNKRLTNRLLTPKWFSAKFSQGFPLTWKLLLHDDKWDSNVDRDAVDFKDETAHFETRRQKENKNPRNKLRSTKNQDKNPVIQKKALKEKVKKNAVREKLRTGRKLQKTKVAQKEKAVTEKADKTKEDKNNNLGETGEKGASTTKSVPHSKVAKSVRIVENEEKTKSSATSENLKNANNKSSETEAAAPCDKDKLTKNCKKLKEIPRTPVQTRSRSRKNLNDAFSEIKVDMCKKQNRKRKQVESSAPVRKTSRIVKPTKKALKFFDFGEKEVSAKSKKSSKTLNRRETTKVMPEIEEQSKQKTGEKDTADGPVKDNFIQSKPTEKEASYIVNQTTPTRIRIRKVKNAEKPNEVARKTRRSARNSNVSFSASENRKYSSIVSRNLNVSASSSEQSSSIITPTKVFTKLGSSNQNSRKSNPESSEAEPNDSIMKQPSIVPKSRNSTNWYPTKKNQDKFVTPVKTPKNIKINQIQWSSTAKKPVKKVVRKSGGEIAKVTAKRGTQKHLQQVREARKQMNFSDKGQDFFSVMSDSSQDQTSFNSQDDLFAPIEDEHCISMTPISKTRDQQSRLGSDFNESTDTEDYMKTPVSRNVPNLNITDSQIKRADKVVQQVLNARKKMKKVEIKSGQKLKRSFINTKQLDRSLFKNPDLEKDDNSSEEEDNYFDF